VDKSKINQTNGIQELLLKYKTLKLQSTYVHRFLTDEKLRSLYFEDHMNNHFKNNPELNRKEIPDLGEYFRESHHLINSIEGLKKYIIRKTALQICEHITINEERKFDYLNKLEDGNYMFIISENEFLKFDKRDNRIVLANYRKYPDNNSTYCMFNITLSTQEEQIPEDEIGQRAYTMFLQILIFILFTDTEKVILEPGQKNGTRKNGKIVNNTLQDFTIIDSAWNKILIRDQEFEIGGHLALRACGPGRTERRLTWIKPYKKKGYVRKIKQL
jgi:hypothetical protein